MKLKARRKTILQALILTSLFWVSLDVLFYVHKQSPNIDLDVVVINKDDSNKQFPSKNHHPSPSERKESRAEIKYDVFDRFPITLRSELFPELVVPSLGEKGKKSRLPRALKKLSKTLFNNHSFDSVLSDRISMNRNLPDARGKEYVYLDSDCY